MKNIVYAIHGFRGRAEGGWRPWLKQTLQTNEVEVHLLQMPNPNAPIQSEWLEELTLQFGQPQTNKFLIGHSLGATTILRFLEKEQFSTPIGGAVLVAGPTLYPRIVDVKSFFTKPFDWKMINSNCKKIIGLYSTNDPLVSIANAKELENNLNCKLKIVDGYGHFSGEEGHTNLPIAIELLNEIMD